jgi:hypothetical protein
MDGRQQVAHLTIEEGEGAEFIGPRTSGVKATVHVIFELQ